MIKNYFNYIKEQNHLYSVDYMKSRPIRDINDLDEGDVILILFGTDYRGFSDVDYIKVTIIEKGDDYIVIKVPSGRETKFRVGERNTDLSFRNIRILHKKLKEDDNDSNNKEGRVKWYKKGEENYYEEL